MSWRPEAFCNYTLGSQYDWFRGSLDNSKSLANINARINRRSCSNNNNNTTSLFEHFVGGAYVFIYYSKIYPLTGLLLKIIFASSLSVPNNVLWSHSFPSPTLPRYTLSHPPNFVSYFFKPMKTNLCHINTLECVILHRRVIEFTDAGLLEKTDSPSQSS